MFKFRISTLLFLITIAAISLGWYVDHTNRNRKEIVGTWYYPTPDIALMGYSTVLVIQTDGSFTKVQNGRWNSMTFAGKYTANDDGTITFHVTSQTDSYGDLESLLSGGLEPKVTQLDESYRCRCGIDKSGYLIIDNSNDMEKYFRETEIQIRWETYMSQKN